MTDQIATAKDWAAMTFEPVIDDSESKFNMIHEMEQAHGRAIVKCFGLKILRMNDVELTRVISGWDDPNVVFDLHENLGELADYYRGGLECAEGARTRLMVALTRFA